MKDKVREVPLRWFGNVHMGDDYYIDRRRLEPQGRRLRGRLKRRCYDLVKEDRKLTPEENNFWNIGYYSVF